MLPSSNTYINREGDEVTGLNLNDLNPNLPDIPVELEMKGLASVPTVFWASSFTLLGGARYMASISPTFLASDITTVADLSGTRFDTTAIVDASLSGFTDLFVVPLGLSWGFKSVDVAFLYGF